MVMIKDDKGIERFSISTRLNELIERIKVKINQEDSMNIGIFFGEVGSGKCQPKGSKVLMSNGEWKNIEDIRIGDKVISPNIRNNTTTFATVKEINNYFSNNNYTIYKKWTNEKLYECSNDHLIPINMNKRMHSGKIYYGNKNIITNMTINQLYSKSKTWFRNNSVGTFQGFCIDKFDSINPDIEPYTLGIWLGDGHFRSKRELNKRYKGKENTDVDEYWNNKGVHINSYKRKIVTSYGYNGYHLSRNVGITTKDIEIIEEISKYYPIMSINHKKGNMARTYLFSVNGILSKQLTELGLEGKGSGDKFIPNEVKKSDVNYRLKLLAGLIDSDGYIDKNGHINYCTKSKRLANDIVEVCRSLGGNSNIRKFKKGIKTLDFVGEYYSININLRKLQNKIPLINKLKKERLKQLYDMGHIHFYIKKTNPSKVYGMSLNNENQLYITNNFCVTHNSIRAMQLGYAIDLTLDITKIAFNKEEFIDAIIKSKKQVVVGDEGISLFFSRGSMTKEGRLIAELMAQTRQKNLCIFICVPEILSIDWLILNSANFVAYVWESKKLINNKTVTIKGNIAFYPNLQGRNYKTAILHYLKVKRGSPQVRIKRPTPYFFEPGNPIGPTFKKVWYPVSEEAYRNKKEEILKKFSSKEMSKPTKHTHDWRVRLSKKDRYCRKCGKIEVFNPLGSV